jgi:hypothetical protein
VRYCLRLTGERDRKVAHPLQGDHSDQADVQQPQVSGNRGVVQVQVEYPLVEIQTTLVDDIVGAEHLVGNVNVTVLPCKHRTLDLRQDEAAHLKQPGLDLINVCKEAVSHMGKPIDCLSGQANPASIRDGSPTPLGVGAQARRATLVSVNDRPLNPALAWLGRPGPCCFSVAALIVAGLGLDHFATIGWQYVLSVCTTLALIAACASLTPEQRAQVAVVVAVATTAELIGSTWWGVYDYRLGNLPLFVPAGHGLVYISGIRMSQAGWVRENPRRFVGIAMAGALAWGIAGLTVLPRLDIAGAMGVATLVVFLVAGRAPTIYAGVFLTVAFLEIYGTWVGTWAWDAKIPGLGIPDGNPPSGAASGYVLFDICALALAPQLLALVRRLRPERSRPEAVEV